MTVPSEAKVLTWFERYSNWGRWGAEDRNGTLNHLSDERRLAAAQLVSEGTSVSCAWEITTEPSVDQRFGTPTRSMLSTGESVVGAGPRWAGASERIELAFHGYSVTHLDSLAHYFWDGRMYNGRSAALVTESEGAQQLAVTDQPAGIVGRGVLLDVAHRRGVDWLEPGEGVLPSELDAVASAQGVELRPGDIVLLRTGYGSKRRSQGPDDVAAIGRAGWHVACIPWLYDHDVAAIGCDTAQDVHPSGYDSIRSPVHAIGIVAMGLWLIDNCDLEPLTQTCRTLDRWDFLLTVSPLRIEGATGSPVNPIAMF